MAAAPGPVFATVSRSSPPPRVMFTADTSVDFQRIGCGARLVTEAYPEPSASITGLRPVPSAASFRLRVV
jgi:hypothetical protein